MTAEHLVAAGHNQLLIGGEWRPASDGMQMEVYDPATAKSLTAVPSASVADGTAAVDAAAAAAGTWAATAPRERGELLRRTFEAMMARQADLAELIVLEMGKSLSEAAAEVAYAADFFRWYSEETVRNQGSVQLAPAGGKRIVVVNQPIGVALLITPWNFPAAMATRKIAPALAAGCTVILKPASDTPLTALALGALLAEVGLPPGVVNVVPSNRSATLVPAVLADSRLRKLSFTGSTEVGRTLLATASQTIVSCSMELGGNAPFLVFDDADVEAAVEGAMIAKMRNIGQSCIAANRFYVHEAVGNEFVERLSAAMGALVVGSGLDERVDVGPLINRGARDGILHAVGASVDYGSGVITGGKAPDLPGFFLEPTVLDRVEPDDPILGDEIFGPVAPIVRFTEDDEAIAMANSTIHGLAAYLYTADLRRGLRVAEAIETGMVGLNRGLISDPAAPFGGVKESGLGREGGHEGMMEYLEPKYIAADW